MMTSADRDAAAVLKAVRDVVPQLQDNAREAEERRWIPDQNIDLLEKSGVFQIAVPRRFGGLDLPLADQVDIATEIARGCGSTGWVSVTWISSAWIATLYPDRAQEEIFADGSVRISGGFTPTGTLTPVEDGYLLNGSWRFNTGIRGAQWNIHAAMLESPDEHEAELFAIVPASELSIQDDWHVSAASGTGSSTSTAKDVFVPTHRVVNGYEAMEGTTGDRSNTGANGRNYTLIPYLMVLTVSVYVGLAKAALEQIQQRVPGKIVPYTHWTDQAKHPYTQIQVGIAANKITAAEALAAGLVRALQDLADTGDSATIEVRAAMRGQIGYAIQLAKEAVAVLYAVSGASVIQRSVPLQRIHRDIEGLSLHGLMSPMAGMEVHGRVLLGLDPDTDYL